jgi:hypothetical protein
VCKNYTATNVSREGGREEGRKEGNTFSSKHGTKNLYGVVLK